MWSTVLSTYLIFVVVSTQSALATCKGGTTVNLNREVCEKKIIFEDDFSGKDIYGKWRHVVRFAGYPDYEFVMYDKTKGNLNVADGVLYLKPSILADAKGEEFLRKGEIDLNTYPPKNAHCTLRPDSGFCHRKANGFQILPPIVSARISSKFRFRYGSVEIRARVPRGDWIYSQIELAPPAGVSRYGQSSGKVVIAMVRGNENLKMPGYDDRLNFGSSWLEAGVFAGTYSPQKTPTMVALLNVTGWHKEFHTYRVDWVPGKLTFSVDGERIGKGSVSTSGLLPPPMTGDAPLDEELEIALGVGVGGIQRFPDGCLSGGLPKPWRNPSPKAMLNFWKAKDQWLPTWQGKETVLQIDSVKVWSLGTP